MIKEIKSWIYYYLVLPLVALLPPGPGRLLIKHAVFRFNLKTDIPAKRQVVAAGFNRVYPDDPANDRNVELNLISDVLLDASTWIIHFCLPSRRKKLIKAEGLENLKEAFAQGKGIVLLTGHTGSFLSSIWGTGIHGTSVSLLTNDAPSDASFTSAYRRFARLTIKTIDKFCRRPAVSFPLGRDKAGATSAARKVRSLLAANEAVISALDVPPHLTSSTERASFLGHNCIFPSGIIRIAERSGSPIVPYYAAWDKTGAHKCTLRFLEPFQLTSDTTANMHKCAGIIEEMVRRYPEQWAHWEAFDQFLDPEKEI